MSWAERISIFVIGIYFGYLIMFNLSRKYWSSIPIEEIGTLSSPVGIITIVITIGMVLGVIWLIFGRKEKE